MSRRMGDCSRVGLERLHDHAPGRIAAAPPRELGDQLERSLLGPEVGQGQPRVCVDHRRELDPGEVVALRDHLRAEQHGALGLGEAPQRDCELLRLRDGVRVEPDQLELRDLARELPLELLRAGPEPGQVGRTAGRARHGCRGRVPAVVAAQRPVGV